MTTAVLLRRALLRRAVRGHAAWVPKATITTVSIEPVVSEADARELHAFEAKMDREYFGIPVIATEDEYVHHIRSGRANAFVARAWTHEAGTPAARGAVVGLATYSMSLNLWDGPQLYWEHCTFDKNFRGYGLFDGFLGSICQRASDAGIVQVCWTLSDWNHRPYALYARLADEWFEPHPGHPHSSGQRVNFYIDKDQIAAAGAHGPCSPVEELPVTVSLATPEDADEIHALASSLAPECVACDVGQAHHGQHGAGPGSPPRTSARDVAEAISDGRVVCVSARWNGNVVGVAYCMRVFCSNIGPELVLNFVGVREAHRRQGIGAAMLNAVRRHASDTDERGIRIFVPEWNTPAIAFLSGPHVGAKEWLDPHPSFPDQPGKRFCFVCRGDKLRAAAARHRERGPGHVFKIQ